MRSTFCKTAKALLYLSAIALPVTAQAQRASENAVNNADDAFGTTVGLETSGIYSEFDTRGFSPVKAGNVRIEGVYFDPVGVLSGRLRQSTAIRIGFAAEDYPFQAPTGIVDHKFRPFPTKNGISVAENLMAYGGTISEMDLRLRNKQGSLAFTGGIAYADNRFVDGGYMHSGGWTARVIARTGGVEIAPWIAHGYFTAQFPRSIAVVTGDFLPKSPPARTTLVQRWAKGKQDNGSYGSTIKAAISNALSLRGGLFWAGGIRDRNYSEIYTLLSADGTARHRVIADPEHDLHSTSGEAQLALRLGKGKLSHRLIAGFRGRNRHTDSGGSHVESFAGTTVFGTPDPRPEPVYAFGPVNRGKVVQTAMMLGYTGKLESVGLINLGVQKGRYRASYHDGRTGLVSHSRDDAWLYNATLGIDLGEHVALYIGTQKGLEDSGTAPENAANRNEQLPATRTTQYDGGVRWKFDGGQLVVNAFQITKPYFSFDAGGAFTQVANVRHRGVEASLSGHFGKRFNLVAGGMLMQPEVTGPGVALGLVGKKPAGAPNAFARVDANYRTDIFGGLTPTASLNYTGERAVGARPLAAGSGRQLMVPGVATLDLGLRQQFRIGKIPASMRAVMLNIFDKRGWKVAGPNALLLDDGRRFTMSLAADF